MNVLDINCLLDRESVAKQLMTFLNEFDSTSNNNSAKRGVYIYGNTGCGKSSFVQNILNGLNYDIVRYDAGDVRTKAVIEKMGNNFIANRSVLSVLSRQPKKIAIIIDEIDGINNSDKGGLEAIIKLARPKKTKKQHLEEKTPNPIICIGNCYIDKKIQKLMEVCIPIKLHSPTLQQMYDISQRLHPSFTEEEHQRVVQYVKGDLRKMAFIHTIYTTTKKKNLGDFFITKATSYDMRQSVRNLIENPVPLSAHGAAVNASDRCSSGLLWHENIIDALAKHGNKKDALGCYVQILDNFCFSDCLDKWKMQYQIWQFNEMKSILGTFKSAHLYHQLVRLDEPIIISPIRFTKILTKFANEFGNKNFIYLTFCQNICSDKKDLCVFLHSIKDILSADPKSIQQTCKMYNIEDTEIKRIYRFLDKYTQPSTSTERDTITINTFSLVEDE